MKCGKNKATTTKMCDSCCKSRQEAVGKRRKERLDKGLCIWCNKPNLGGQLCLNHYLRKMARQYLGNSKRYKELQELFIKQDGICPYTGKKITLGVDTSIDHKFPKSRGGDLGIENLQWVHIRVNFMKQDLLEEEFYEMISLIYEHKSRKKTLS